MARTIDQVIKCIHAFDAFPAHVAIVDEAGTIIRVNEAWRNFSEANEGDASLTCEGVNYLSALDSDEKRDAIEAVINGNEERYEFSYPCHSPEEKRWFLAKFSHLEGKGALIVHTNVSALFT